MCGSHHTSAARSPRSKVSAPVRSQKAKSASATTSTAPGSRPSLRWVDRLLFGSTHAFEVAAVGSRADSARFGPNLHLKTRFCAFGDATSMVRSAEFAQHLVRVLAEG